MTELQTEVARATEEVAAPPEDVFDALLDPEALAEWFRPPQDASTRDWTVEPVPGGAWHATTVAPDGETGKLVGEIVTIDPPRALELRWRSDSAHTGDSTVRFDLEPVWRAGERLTRITVTQVEHSPLASRVEMRGPLASARQYRAMRPRQIVRTLRAYLASAIGAAR